MRFDRFDYTVWAVMLFLFAALVGLVWIGQASGARFVLTFPDSSQPVSPYTRLGVEFAQPMLPETVETRFSLEPEVTGKFSWQGRQMWFQPDTPLSPSGAYTVRLLPGAQSEDGRFLKEEIEWEIQVREPWIAYLSPSRDERALWRIPASGGEALQLTPQGVRVWDYSVSAVREQIVFSVGNEQGGLDLWIVNYDGSEARVLLDCGLDRCYSPDWSPDGSRLAYAREIAGLAPGEPTGAPRIWLLDVEGGESQRLFANTQRTGYAPRWSPPGDRLAYYDIAESGIRVVNLDSAEEFFIPTRTATLVGWSPDGEKVAFTSLDPSGNTENTHIFIADIVREEIGNLPGIFGDDTLSFEDPRWSSTGDWLLMAVRQAGLSPGWQVWRVSLDGQAGLRVADDPDYTYYNYRWDPWGEAIALQRTQLRTGNVLPEVVVWRPDDLDEHLLVEDAADPEWLP